MTAEEIVELAKRAFRPDADYKMNADWCRDLSNGFLEVAQMRRDTDRTGEHFRVNLRRETMRATDSVDETKILSGRRCGPHDRRADAPAMVVYDGVEY